MFVKNFYYYMLTCIECNNCNHISYNVNPNDIMCVSLPDNWQHNPKLTLNECIDDWEKNKEFFQYKTIKASVELTKFVFTKDEDELFSDVFYSLEPEYLHWEIS